MSEEILCITNTRHPELANVVVNPCAHRPAVEGEDGKPRRATHGFLCTTCWHKLSDALKRVATLVVHLRSIDTTGQVANDRVSSSLTWRLPIPASWMAADSIMAALGSPPIPSTAGLAVTKAMVEAAVRLWKNPETVVSRVDGAVSAVVLYRHVQTALARWPSEDADREMPAPLRCPGCQKLTLWYRAPLEYLDDLEVKCGSCGHVQAWEEFTLWTQIFTKAFEVEQKAEARRRRIAREKRKEA